MKIIKGTISVGFFKKKTLSWAGVRSTEVIKVEQLFVLVIDTGRNGRIKKFKGSLLLF